MMSSAPQIAISVHAFLAARDDDSMSLGSPIFRRLKYLKRDPIGCSVEVLVAVDGQGNSAQGRELGITHYRLAHKGEHESTSLQGPLSFPESLRRFLEWAELKRNDIGLEEQIPRVLILSSHGVAGLGLSPSVIRALISKSKELLSILAIAEKWLLDNRVASNARLDSEESPAIADLARRLRQLFAETEFDEFKNLSDMQLVFNVDQLIKLQRQPRRLETGITLAASGIGADDRLSFKKFARIVEDLGYGHTMNRFDVIILHSCSTGIVEAVFQLRNAAKVVIASPVYLCTPHVGYGLALAGILQGSGNRTNGSFAESVARAILAQEKAEQNRLGASAAVFAARTETMEWANLQTLVGQMAGELVRLLGDNNATATIRRIRNEVKCHTDCKGSGVNGPCVCVNHDLLDLGSRLAHEFPLQFNSIHEGLVKASESILVGHFETELCQSDCFSSGMSLFFPKSREYLFGSYSPSDDDGFDFLEGTNWHNFLRAFTAGH